MRIERAGRPGLPRLLSLLVAGAAGFASLLAFADTDDTLNCSIGLTRQHDSNLFRLPEGVSPLLYTGKPARGDDLTSATFGVSLKKAYSLQQIEAGFERSSNRYGTYTYLNNDADSGRAAWRWQLTPRLRGNLTADRSQTLMSFTDYTGYATKNVRTITAVRADAEWNLFRNGWYVHGGVDRYETRNSQTFTQDQGSRVASADAGVRYVFPSGNWIDVLSRVGVGDFLDRSLDAVNQLDNGFRDRRTEVRGYWAVGGKSLLEGAAGYATRDYDHFSSRDYSGGVGNLKWTWQPTGKLALVASWKRDFAAYIDVTSSYYRQDVYSVGPVWQVDAKVRLSLKLDHTRRDYRGAVTTLPFTARDDRIDLKQVTADWTPLRALTLSGYVIDDRRASSLAGANYGARVIGANAALNF